MKKVTKSGDLYHEVYLASGWFSPEWLEEVENIKAILDKHEVTYFSPKDDNLCDNDASESLQDQIFNGNINGMKKASWMLCNTRNKDMGTLFEAGYFDCLGKPIVYFCAGLPEGAQFNLMLAASGVKVCRSLEELDDYIERSIENGKLLTERYQGEIE